MAVGMLCCGAALAKRSAMAFVATSFALFGLRCRAYAFFMADCFTDEDARRRAPVRAMADSDRPSAPRAGSRRNTPIQVLTRIKSLKLARIAPIPRESGAFRGFPPKAQTPIIAQAISTAGGSDRTRISPTGEQPATTSLQGSPKGQACPPRRCSCATLR